MNVLPSATTEALPPSPQRAPAEVSAVRALDRVGDFQAPPRRGPQGSPREQAAAAERLRSRPEPDRGLSLTGRRAVAAYSAHGQEDERAYMRQVLGFEIEI